MIYIVSGLPRSGTSLMMKMLHKGGLDVFAREYNSYEAQCTAHLNAGWDEDRPLNNGEEWLPSVEGKAIKVLHPFIYALSMNFQYKIIWMDRTTKDQAKSMKKLHKAMGQDVQKGYVSRVSKQIPKDTKDCIETLNNCDNIELLRVSFDRLLKKPEMVELDIYDFIEEPDDPYWEPQILVTYDKMAPCVKPRSKFKTIPFGQLEHA